MLTREYSSPDAELSLTDDTARRLIFAAHRTRAEYPPTAEFWRDGVLVGLVQGGEPGKSWMGEVGAAYALSDADGLVCNLDVNYWHEPRYRHQRLEAFLVLKADGSEVTQEFYRYRIDDEGGLRWYPQDVDASGLIGPMLGTLKEAARIRRLNVANVAVAQALLPLSIEGAHVWTK